MIFKSISITHHLCGAFTLQGIALLIRGDKKRREALQQEMQLIQGTTCIWELDFCLK